MAAAAAATGSVLSSPFQTLKITRSENEAFPIRIQASRRLLSSSSSSVSHSNPMCPLPSASLFRKRRVAALTQEEAAATVEVSGEAVDKEGGEVSEAVNTKLYFGNLPFNIDSSQLSALIQQFATPDLVEVRFDGKTGRSRGFGFATMNTVEDCNAVIDNIDGSEFMGRRLIVNFSDKPKEKEKEALYPETEYKLFVGNLGWSVTSESLTKLFEQQGQVVGARVLYDGQSGKPRGFGFVCYATQEQMESAIRALNGVVLDGRPIRVSLAQGRQSKS